MTADIIKNIPGAYRVKEYQYVEEMHADTVLLEHKKTKARLLLVSNDDTNKVFNIAFRTPVYNSTGVPHIIEHTVLCGSDKFPAKDPFVELVKGSLNTFLNAMTYSDKTMYPVASYNDKDFRNLMHVYLDAVFYPNIYKNRMIFEQEGWHYELESPEDTLKINGVVYNEMKGAYSSPEQVLYREIPTALFPDTTYFYSSGGNPDDIPDLTYEEYLDFHRTYYHPSNSYIYLYGDFDVYEKLNFIDEEYLSAFDYKEVDSKIRKQPAFEKAARLEKSYALSSEEDTKDKTYLSYNVVIGDSLDKELYIAFQILNYVLMSAPGAVLKKALLDSGIAKDVFGDYDNGICQPYFSMTAKGSNPECEAQFMAVIHDTLKKLVAEGISKKSLEGALNNLEFKFREADFGRWPKGLMYGLQMFDSWLYDDDAPLIHLQAFDTFKKLREKIQTNYFEELIQKYLLDNTHAALIILKPEQGLTNIKDEALVAKLQNYKAQLSDTELQAIIDETKALRAFQDTPSTDEELDKIPMIEISDISKNALKDKNQMTQVADMPVLCHDIQTNGIDYFKALFEADNISNEMLPYIGLLTSVLGGMNTEKYTYSELTDEINMYTGGISVHFDIFSEYMSDKCHAYMVIEGKALEERIHELGTLMQEIIFKTDFSDKARLKEIIAQRVSRLSMGINSSGHTAAVLRAASYYDKSSYMKEMVSGIAFYDFMKNLDAHFDELIDDVIEKLNALCHRIFRRDKLMFDLTAVSGKEQALETSVKHFSDACYTEAVSLAELTFTPEHKNEAFMTSGMVQFDAISGNFAKKGFAYHGALQVLRVMMDYEYLWQNIRVKGGAYGCMSNFTSNGSAYFVTYRDPNLGESYEIFKAAADYIRNFSCSDRDMTKYVIGAISNIDTPLTPASEGDRSMALYLTKTPFDAVQKRRDELLNTDIAIIRSFADLIEAFVSENYICVVGSEHKIKEESSMFNSIRQLG